jgi:nucleoside-diphosphate-sugar epimerase
MTAARSVVTGGCGFLGSHLAEALITRGDEVTIIDSAPPPADQALSREYATFVEGDVRDADALAKAITPDTDVVYHLAAQVGVDRYLSRPLDVIDVNVDGTRNVLATAASTGSKVVVASTSEVFGKNPAVPWAEDADRLLGPTSADRWTYSTSKALAEHLTFAFVRQFGLSATIVRYFNVYGPRQRPAFVISRSVHRALNGRRPVVYDSGEQTRCFTFIDDAIDGTLRAGADPRADGNVFNLGNMTETTVGEAIDLVRELTGFEPAPTPVGTDKALGAQYQDLPRRRPDSTKASEVLGWSGGTSLRGGLTATIEWARTNPWWLALPDSGA